MSAESKSKKKKKKNKKKYLTSNALNLDKPNVGGNDYEPWKNVMNFLDQDEVEMMRLEGKTFANAAVGKSLKYVEVNPPLLTPRGDPAPAPAVSILPRHVKPDLHSALVAFQKFKAANPGRRFEIRLRSSTQIFGELGYKTGYNLKSWFGNPTYPGYVGGGNFFGLELPLSQKWNNLKIISPEIEVLYGLHGPQLLNYSVKLVTRGVNGYVNDLAFYNCRGLRSLILPQNLKLIGERAFENCVNLEHFGERPIKPEYAGILTFPQSLKSIKNFAFGNCKKIKSIVFPPNLSLLGKKTFERTNVIKVDFASCKTLHLIGGYAFFECKNLRHLKLPPNLQTIEPRAFAGCSSLTNLVIPTNVNRIFSRAFEGCTRLRNIRILESCTDLDIARYAFEHCAFEEIYFPARVKSIGFGAFRNCPNLREVSLNTSWGTSIKENSFDSDVNIIRRDMLGLDQQGLACTIMLRTLRF